MLHTAHVFRMLLLPFLIALLISCTTQNSGRQQTIPSPAQEHSEIPYLSKDDTGTLFLSWVEPSSREGYVKQMYSVLDRDRWTSPSQIAQSDSWFVNWADYPTILGKNGKAIAAHQLYKIPGNTYSYNVNIMFSSGGSWTGPVIPHEDSTATEHGFVSMIPWKSDRVFAIWLDGRQTHNRADEEYHDIEKAMTLRSAVINNHGKINEKHQIDDTVCDCCQTALVSTAKGPVAAYRDRTGDEIRDIYVSRYADGSWSDPRPVYRDNWKIGACPVNGPALASKDSLVVIAWYTAAGDTATVKAAYSRDYGKTFSSPYTIDKGDTQGRVDVAISDSNTVYISTLGNTNVDKSHLLLTRLSLDNGSQEVFNIAPMNDSRRSGFPQMEYQDGRLVFAWTHIGNDGKTRVKTSMLVL